MLPGGRRLPVIPLEPFGFPAALVVLAGVLAGAWAGTNLFRGHDLLAYWDAAGRLLAGGRLFSPAELSGPISPFTRLGYLYPPPLAIVLAPLRAAGLGFDALGVAWDAAQGGALVLAGLLALRAGGARSIGLAVVIALVAAPVWWYPERSLLADGNVGGVIALLLALAVVPGAVGGAAVGIAALLKVAPAAALPAVLFGSRRARAGALAALGAGLLVCLIVAPADTLAVPTVLANLAAGGPGGRFDFGLAATLALVAGPDGAAAGHVLGLLGLFGAVAFAVFEARRGRHRTALVIGAWATLLVSGTIWIHYLVVAAVPVGLTWNRATPVERGVVAVALASGWAILLPEGSAHLAFWVAAAALATVSLRVVARSEPAADEGPTGWRASAR